MHGGEAADRPQDEIGKEARGKAAHSELRRIAADRAIDTEVGRAENLLGLVSFRIDPSMFVDAEIVGSAPRPTLRDLAIVPALEEWNPREGLEAIAVPHRTVRIVENGREAVAGAVCEFEQAVIDVVPHRAVAAEFVKHDSPVAGEA